ncbi:hypothetical protein [Nocardia wallacei]|uniref:hypothetical protein n=1 Tax=Nocardia wallacei TaxID=480035 RepID=UPI002457456C|nr:hypothetical protein [Nocardia wallacei]
MPSLSPPTVALPPHRVSTDELITHFRHRYTDHPRLDRALALMRRTGVDNHWVSRPLIELSDTNGRHDDRVRRHHEDALALSETAARGALHAAGVSSRDVGWLIYAGAGGHTIPGIDVALIDRLGLPEHTRRLPVTQMGCAGGAFAIARASQLAASAPGEHVLIVCADVFYPYIHPDDTGTDTMIFRGLISDAAAACVVRTDTSDAPRLSITETWEHTAPGTSDIVGTATRTDGWHLFNSPALYDTLTDALPALVEWFGATPEFVISHPGGPRILDTLGKALDPRLLQLSQHSLRDLGNAGAASVLDVAARFFTDPPTNSGDGLIFGVGPGLTLIACRCHWHTN